MSLLDEITASVSTRGPSCNVALVTPNLAADDRLDLERAIADRNIPATAIERALKGRGVRLSDQSIARHRQGRCQCPTS